MDGMRWDYRSGSTELDNPAILARNFFSMGLLETITERGDGGKGRRWGETLFGRNFCLFEISHVCRVGSL